MPSDFEGLQAALPKRYTLLRELDRGGMSHVYLAREELPDRDVAIKVLDRELSAQLGRERFIREVEMTSRLAHPHIVPIFAAGDAGGHLYYVMPFIGGESLRDRLEREGCLPIADALRVTRQVAGALAHAHAAGIVHRDIKPANILFQSGHAVVADFGIARALFAAEERTTLTGAGHVLGTPDYMSPEQIDGKSEVDDRADQYALACVLYEMLGGQPPFLSRTAQATLARHLTDRVPSLRALRDGVSGEIEDALRTALSKAPADRFQSIDAFISALQASGDPAVSPAYESDDQRRVLSPMGLSVRLAGLLLVVAAIGVAYNAWFGREQVVAMPQGVYQDSVAMMPLDNVTGDPRYDHVGRSIAAQVENHFQQVAAIKVIGEYSVRSLYDDDLGYAVLLDSLGVGHILEGWVELRSDGLAVNVTDTDALGVRTQTTVFDPFPPEKLDSAIVAIAHEVAVSFLERHRIETTRLAGADATVGPGTEAYLLANEALGERTRAGMLRAEELLHESIALDSSYASAYAAMSSVYALSLSYRYDLGHDPFDVAARSLAYADRAIELDPSLSDGYAARGYALVLLGLDIDAAEADFDTALELAPNAPSGSSWASRVLAERGQIDEALAAAARARDADRLQAGRHMALAALELQAGRYREAIRSAQLAYGIAPELSRAAAREAIALALLGQAGECLDVELGVYSIVHAVCYQALDQSTVAAELVADAEAAYASGDAGGPEYLPDLIAAELASYYAFAGDAREAARWVGEAYAASPVGVDPRVLESELYSAVRDAPVFAAALTEAEESAHERVEVLWSAHPLAIGPDAR